MLEQAGLIECDKRGRSRYCRLSSAGLRRAATWFEQRRHFWESQIDKLAAYFAAAEDET